MFGFGQKNDASKLLAQNGFIFIPGWLNGQDVAELSSRLVTDISKSESQNSGNPLQSVGNACQRSRAAQDFALSDQVLETARRYIAPDPVFLQACDIHCGFVQGNWHRDCTNKTFGKGPDWKSRFSPRKMMIYLEASDYGFCVIPGSHRAPPKLPEEDNLDDYVKVETFEDNFKFDKTWARAILLPKPGDLAIFDLRLRHRGQPLESAMFVKRAERKLTLSYVFGDRDESAHRFHSFRTILKRGYEPLPRDFRDRMRLSGVDDPMLDSNYFDLHPDERKFASVA